MKHRSEFAEASDSYGGDNGITVLEMRVKDRLAVFNFVCQATHRHSVPPITLGDFACSIDDANFAVSALPALAFSDSQNLSPSTMLIEMIQSLEILASLDYISLLLTRRFSMHAFSTGLAVLLALGILAIGSQYVLNPTRMSHNFGLPLPDGANATWWLRLKGVRDIVSGLLVIALLAWGNPRDLAMLLLV
jgi:hypothetical protein